MKQKIKSISEEYQLQITNTYTYLSLRSSSKDSNVCSIIRNKSDIIEKKVKRKNEKNKKKNLLYRREVM